MDACPTPRSDERPPVHDGLNLQRGRQPGQGRYLPLCSWISAEDKSITGLGSLRVYCPITSNSSKCFFALRLISAGFKGFEFACVWRTASPFLFLL